MKTGYYIAIIFALLCCSSCMDDDAWYEVNDDQLKLDSLAMNSAGKSSGVFILNEGNFMFDNASLSYYLPDSMRSYNEVFYQVNNAPLGDVAQSMVIRDSLGYIVMNNSSKIYVININTFEFAGKITGLTSPRYMHFINDNKAYVSDLYAGAIAIVDPRRFEITGYIDVHNPASGFNQHSTEQMIAFEDKVFTNCWSFDHTILVIDTATDLVVDSIDVPLQPNSMFLDRNNKLWVLCDGGFEGNPAGHVPPALIRIDPRTLEIEKLIHFELDDQPIELTGNGTKDTLYFLNRDVFRHAVDSDNAPEVFLPSPYSTSLTGGFYGIGVDPHSSEIYVADAIDQVQRGTVYRFHPSGIPIDTFKTGMNPGFFCFRGYEYSENSPRSRAESH